MVLGWLFCVHLAEQSLFVTLIIHQPDASAKERASAMERCGQSSLATGDHLERTAREAEAGLALASKVCGRCLACPP